MEPVCPNFTLAKGTVGWDQSYCRHALSKQRAISPTIVVNWCWWPWSLSRKWGSLCLNMESWSFLEATVRDLELSPSDYNVFDTHGAISLVEMTGRFLPNIGHQFLLVSGNGTSRDMYVSSLNLWCVYFFLLIKNLRIFYIIYYDYGFPSHMSSQILLSSPPIQLFVLFLFLLYFKRHMLMEFSILHLCWDKRVQSTGNWSLWFL